jgi:hypothetical protein
MYVVAEDAVLGRGRVPVEAHEFHLLANLGGQSGELPRRRIAYEVAEHVSVGIDLMRLQTIAREEE